MTLPRLPGSDALDLAASDEPALLTPWGRIAHQSYRDDNYEIYLANDDGSGEARLTASGDSDIQPDLNRGATRVAYASKSGDYEIRSMNANGSDNRPLTDNSADDAAPDWSPDGSRIAFQSYRDGQAEIYVMNADGTQQTRLTSNAAYDGQPAWSPDGSKIAFVSTRGGLATIWVMNADGGGPVQLSTQPYSFDPTWSPDGSAIAYDADGDGNGWQELWMMNADGTNARLLYGTQTTADAWAGSWSPDGEIIAFTEITYVYYQGDWYWTTARLRGTSVVANWSVSLHGSDVAMNPDWQSIDGTPPSVSLTALPAVSPSPIRVSWTGTDAGPSGLHSVQIQVKEEPSTSWVDWTQSSSPGPFAWSGLGGHTFSFRIRGKDNAGNQQAWSSASTTTVEALPPESTVTVEPFARGATRLSWGGIDPGGSGIVAFDVQQRVGPGQPWTDLALNTTSQALTVSGAPGETLAFRVRGRDAAQNQENWGAEADGQVTFYDWQATGPVHDNAGTPIVGVQVTASPAALGSLPGVGVFSVYGLTAMPAYQLAWSRAGYGLTPATSLTTYGDTRVEVALPPTDDILRDGTFEAGTSLPGSWAAFGSLPVALTTTVRHTGQTAAFLGETRSGEWDAIQDVANVAGNADNISEMVVDAHGTVHVIWVDGASGTESTDVMYTSRPAGGSWTTPARLSTLPGARDPALAVDPEDTLHAVWSADRTYYLSRPIGQGWSAPAPIASGPLSTPDVATGPNGLVFVSGFNPGGSALATGGHLVVRQAGVWSPPMVVSPYAGRLAPDLQGGLHLVSRGFFYPSTWIVQYRYRAADGNWTGPTTISTGDGGSPDITVDRDGTAHVVWPVFNAMAYRNKPVGQEWSALETIPGEAYGAEPRLAADGNVIYLVQSLREYLYGPIHLVSRVRSEAGVWSDPIPLDGDSQFSDRPSLFIQPAGGPSVIWQRWDTPGPDPVRRIQYRGPTPAENAGTAGISQSFTIPITQTVPTLSYFFKLTGASPLTGSGLRTQLQTASGTIELAHVTIGSADWSFQTFDVSAWAGQVVTLTFQLDQATGGPIPSALIDDVALGSTHPDLWVATSDVSGRPGEQLVYQITYGNQGGAPAAGARVHLSLPAGIQVLSTSVPTGGTAPDLWWDVGSLGGHSGSATIVVTARSLDGVRVPAQWPHGVRIETASIDLEDHNDLWNALTTLSGHQIFLPLLRR